MSNTVYGKPLPSIHVVRNYYAENNMTETRGALLESRPRNNTKASRHRMWAVRWRKRYGVKCGRIRFGEPLSESNKRRKVEQNEKLDPNFWFRGFGDAKKILVPFSGTKIWLVRHIFALWAANWAQKTGRIFSTSKLLRPQPPAKFS